MLWPSTTSRRSGPGGNFLASKYTRRHHREFWTGDLLDHTGHDRWVADGALTLGRRVRDKADRLRGQDRLFTLSDAQDAGLKAIVAEALRERRV